MRNPLRYMAVAAAVLAAIGVVAQAASASGQSDEKGSHGGRLRVAATAAVTVQGSASNRWRVEDSTRRRSVTIPQGAAKTVTFTLEVDRTTPSLATQATAKGEVCVTNTTNGVVDDLAVSDSVQVRQGHHWTALASVRVVSGEQIAAGATECYQYELTFSPVRHAAAYRNVAVVYKGKHARGSDTDAFTLPKQNAGTTDASADLSHVLTCPTGFTCTTTNPGPWHLTGSADQKVMVTVTNTSVGCGKSAVLTDVATVKATDSGKTDSDRASVRIWTGRCSPAASCTHTVGYWKTHAGFNGNNGDKVTPLLPIVLGTAGGANSVSVVTAGQAVDILSFGGHPSNGIRRLMAQLLAAKLNAASGANASSIAGVAAAADAFLAGHTPASWDDLSRDERQAVQKWSAALERFNSSDRDKDGCSS